MTHPRIVVLGLLLLVISNSAQACADPLEAPFSHELARAKSVFIFRLLSLELVARTPGSNTLVGDIEIVRSLKGERSFQRVTYVDVRCGGMGLRVGHYFAAATRQSGPALKLAPGDNSVIDISQDYAVTYPPFPEQSKWQWHIENYLKGIPLPRQFTSYEFSYLTHGVAPRPLPEPGNEKP